MAVLPGRALSAADGIHTVSGFFARHSEDGDEEDMVAYPAFGKPREMTLPALVDVLNVRIQPQGVVWFAFRTSGQQPREVIAGALKGGPGV